MDEMRIQMSGVVGKQRYQEHALGNVWTEFTMHLLSVGRRHRGSHRHPPSPLQSQGEAACGHLLLRGRTEVAMQLESDLREYTSLTFKDMIVLSARGSVDGAAPPSPPPPSPRSPALPPSPAIQRGPDAYENCTAPTLPQCDPRFATLAMDSYAKTIDSGDVLSNSPDGGSLAPGQTLTVNYFHQKIYPLPTMETGVVRTGSKAIRFDAALDHAVSFPLPKWMGGAHMVSFWYTQLPSESRTAFVVELQCQAEHRVAWSLELSAEGATIRNLHSHKRAADRIGIDNHWHHALVRYDLDSRLVELVHNEHSVGLLDLPSTCFFADRLRFVAQTASRCWMTCSRARPSTGSRARAR